jgi:serine/threonine protein kinase
MSPDELAPGDRNWSIQAFRQEAQMLANLDHRGLTRVTDFFPEGGNWYLVMDFVAGETLEVRLMRAPEGRLPIDRALHITRQLCDVLTYLHNRQPPVIFRDLKPGNIMLTPNDEVKLIDFGIARFFKPGKTQDTVLLGTTGYAAPEQYGGLGQSDPRTDVYSLGALLHHMVTGYDPTAAASPFPLPDPRSMMPSIPSRIADVITQATQMHPEFRYTTIQEIQQVLFPPADAAETRQKIPPFLVYGLAAIPGAILLVGALIWITQAPQPSPALTTTRSPTRQPTHVPPTQTTETPPPTRQTAPATSTVAPTASPTPKNTRVTAQVGENLYAVSRRYCPGRFQEYAVEPDLDTYARSVASYNGLSWVGNVPLLQPGQELEMLPCPP